MHYISTPKNDLEHPALVFDENILRDYLEQAKRICTEANCSFLYSLKACSTPAILEIIQEYVEGFSCSSVFEATLANQILFENQKVQYISPGIREQEIKSIAKLANLISANSKHHCNLLAKNNLKFGVRINPQLSFAKDLRYDPCKPNSKLGITIPEFLDFYNSNTKIADTIIGLHFHTNCDSETFAPLLKTVKHLADKMPHILEHLEWINLGGGYYFTDDMDYEFLIEAVEILKSKFGVEVFVEPGGAIIRDSGSIYTQIIDLFKNDDQEIAIVDTTTNHIPEVFEYQYSPTVKQSIEIGKNIYQIAGCSCLAGDIFGIYSFAENLQIGDVLEIKEAGAYSCVKSTMFNGICTPTIYLKNAEIFTKIHSPCYSDFINRCGGNLDASCRPANYNTSSKQ